MTKLCRNADGDFVLEDLVHGTRRRQSQLSLGQDCWMAVLAVRFNVREKSFFSPDHWTEDELKEIFAFYVASKRYRKEVFEAAHDYVASR